MGDLISRQDAIDARRYTFGNDEFSLEAAYHDCKLVFDGITDDDSFQEADTGLILYYANEIIYALQEALEGKDTNVPTNDHISRQDAIDALKICDNNEDGINCHKCPLRDVRWDGAWQDDETNCYTKLMRDSAKLLELAEPELIEKAKAEIKTSIDELYENGKRHAIFVRNNGELVIEGLRMALEILNQVEPKSKKGRWIYEERKRLDDETDDGAVYIIEKWWMCSRCSFDMGFMVQKPKEKYCPNCGADMREG